MQFCILQRLIFPWTGLHSQRQPGTFLLIQLVINEVEPVKKKHSLIPQLILEGQLFRNNRTIRSYTEYLGNIITFVPRKRQAQEINTTCSKAVADWKLLVHIQEHCRTVQTTELPPICNSWGQQTVL